MTVQDLTIEGYRSEFEGNDQDYQLIDVREIDEWEAVRIPNTVNIPLSQFQNRLNEVEKTSPIVLVCRTGARSHMVGEFLVANGYSNVYNLIEGTMGWMNRDLPVEQG